MVAERTLTYQEFLNYSREQARVAQADRDRSAKQITALQAETDELRALVRGLRDQLAKSIGDERIAAIRKEKAA